MTLGDIDLALETGARSVAIAPNDYNVRGVFGRVLAFDGRYEAGVRELELAARLSPVAPDWIPIFIAEGYLLTGDTQRARVPIEQLLAADRSSAYNEAWARTTLALILDDLGNEEAAREEIIRAHELQPSWTISAQLIWLHFLDPKIADGWAETWRRLGREE